MSILRFNIVKDPYNEDDYIFTKSRIKIFSGVNIITGCNGSGKSTLIDQIKERIIKREISYIYYSDMSSGRSNATAKYLNNGMIDLLSLTYELSEGEKLWQNFISDVINKFGKTVKDIKDHNKSNIIIFLFDGIDSGLSVDAVESVKKVFDFIIDQSKAEGIDSYIICTENSYEMTIGYDCIDSTNFDHMYFTSYDSYSRYIKNSHKNILERRSNAFIRDTTTD